MSAITLHVPPGAKRLPDNAEWTNRFEIKSESSDRLYVVSQNKQKRHWACSCPAWRTRRACKHLKVLQLPAGERPHEVIVS